MKSWIFTYMFMLAIYTISYAQLASTSFTANANNVTGLGTVTLGVGTPLIPNFSTFLGFESGLNNTTNSNTFIGYRAGKDSNSSQNVFIGSSAGSGSVNSAANVSIGTFSSSNSNGASRNLVMGISAGSNNEGDDNVFLGYQCGKSNKGNNNIFIGANAGDENDVGNDNVYIGRRVGFKNTGSRNVFIGNGAGQDFLSKTDNLVIENSNSLSPLIYGDFASDKVGINTTNLINTIGGQNITNYSLYVEGGILSDEVRVRTTWADYVFDNNYPLQSIEDLETFISKNGHLPNCPSEYEVSNQGLELGDITRIQQEKIEELTLYIIQLKKDLIDLTNIVETLKK